MQFGILQSVFFQEIKYSMTLCLRFAINSIFAIIIIWIIGYLFCDSPIVYRYDKLLQKYIQTPGTVHTHKSEGFGTTYKGKHGINGVVDITSDSRSKIIIWGDSYVEAHQVDDRVKVPQLLTEFLAEKRLGSDFISFGVGMSGDSVADYYFDIPKYEKLILYPEAHYLLITSLEDIIADVASDNKRGVFASNPYRLYYDSWQPLNQGIKKKLYDLKIYFVWEPVKRILASIRDFKIVAPDSSKKDAEDNYRDALTEKELRKSWSFLLSELRKVTENDVTIVYCPAVPYIEANEIHFQDRDSKIIALFKELALHHNIQFLNCTPKLNEFYRHSGKFPRGFVNSKPGVGHLNEAGHTIVARLILEDFLQKRRL